ncbi:MAG TPA: radical SAM/SPASM domain-containing protein [Longimicrobium sp.]
MSSAHTAVQLARKARQALAQGFRPAQLVNRALYEVGSRARTTRVRYDPVWLHLFVTSRCNFRCRFCTNHAVAEKGMVQIGYHPPVQDMTLEVFREILGRNDRAMVCSFCGVGEPLLNRELFDMIRLARSRRMITEVVSNGSLLNEQNMDRVLDAGLDRLTISLLESDPDAHSHLIAVGKPYLPRIMASLEHLAAARAGRGSRLRIKISRVLTRSTLDRADDFIRLGVRLGVDEIIFNNLIFASITEFEQRECLFDTAENRAFFDELGRAWAGHPIKLGFPVLLKEEKQPGCKWYWKNLCVDAAGNVSGCGRFITPKPEYGNFRDAEGWNGPHFQEMRRSFTGGELLECCRNCVESSCSTL